MLKCLKSNDKVDLINIINEDVIRDSDAIKKIKENPELVKDLSDRPPQQLINIYQSHKDRAKKLLDKIDKIPECECVTENLEDAMKLHEVHINDPKTATDESQILLNKFIKDAYKCAIQERIHD